MAQCLLRREALPDMLKKILSIPLYIAICVSLTVVTAEVAGRPWKVALASPYTIIGIVCGTLTYCFIVLIESWLNKKM